MKIGSCTLHIQKHNDIYLAMINCPRLLLFGLSSVGSSYFILESGLLYTLAIMMAGSILMGVCMMMCSLPGSSAEKCQTGACCHLKLRKQKKPQQNPVVETGRDQGGEREWAVEPDIPFNVAHACCGQKLIPYHSWELHDSSGVMYSLSCADLL